MPPPLPVALRPRFLLEGEDLSLRLLSLVVHASPGEATRCQAELALPPIAAAADAWHDGERARLGAAARVQLGDAWQFDGVVQRCRIVLAEARAPVLAIESAGSRDAAIGERPLPAAMLTWGADLIDVDASFETAGAGDAAASADQALRARATVAGAPDLRLGDAVDLRGLGAPIDGRFTLQALTLRWDLQRGATLDFAAGRPLP